MQALLLMILGGAPAFALVDEDCNRLAMPEGYDEQVQQDFLANYVPLAVSLSPLHGPIPHKAGRGAIGLDLAMIPPLGCGKRFVNTWSKTEDTNKSLVVPRPRVTFAFKPLADLLYPYAGLGLVPPVPVGGTSNLIVSAELGAGMYLGPHLELGARGHATLQHTFGNVATAYNEGDPEKNDLLVASTTGADLHLGWELGGAPGRPVLTPYLSLGFTDVSTFFWIGDDSEVPLNKHPYFGPVASVGADALLRDRIRLAGEFYAAPGGHLLADPSPDDVTEGAFSRYGHLYTARLRIAYEL